MVSLNGIQWALIAIVSILPIIIIEGQKKLNELIFGRPVYEYKEEVAMRL